MLATPQVAGNGTMEPSFACDRYSVVFVSLIAWTPQLQVSDLLLFRPSPISLERLTLRQDRTVRGRNR